MPKVPPVYTEFLGARVGPELYESAKLVADRKGMSISDWLRMIVKDAALPFMPVITDDFDDDDVDRAPRT